MRGFEDKVLEIDERAWERSEWWMFNILLLLYFVAYLSTTEGVKSANVEVGRK